MNTASTWARGGLVGLVVLAGLITDAASSSGEVPLMDPGTPEAALQTYLHAVLRDDAESAARLLAADSDCDVEDLEEAWVGPDAYAVLHGTTTGARTAQVNVSVTTGSTGMVSTAWSEDDTLLLVREAGEWRVTGTPWPMFDCRGVLP